MDLNKTMSQNMKGKKCKNVREKTLKDGRVARIPRFSNNLHNLVTDPSTDHIVCWSAAKNDHSFII